MLETVIDFLREKPGYSKEGGHRLSELLRKRGLDASPDLCRQAIYRFNKESEMDVVEEDLDYISSIRKAAQKSADVNRIERKIWRNRVRVENSLEELSKALIDSIRKEGLSISTKSHKTASFKASKIIVQLSDLHLNELVDIDGNKYDFFVAAKRLKKYADEVKILAMSKGASEVILVMTGDVLNSDRRTDELLNMATNRANASVLASKLISSFILDIQEFFNVTVLSVSGNESRIREDLSFDNLLVSDNYDFLVYNMIKLLLADCEGITFINTDQFETVIKVNGANILITHGATMKKETQQSVQQLIGKHAVKGTRIDYVIFGHIHFANITDLYARSSSLVGSNTYSDRALGLASVASQNIHIVDFDGSISNYRVNLQTTEGIIGYEIKNDYDAYNPKLNSYSKLNEIIEV